MNIFVALSCGPVWIILGRVQVGLVRGWPSAPFDMCMSEKPRGGYFRALWNEKPFLGLYVIDYNLDEDPGKDHWQAPGMVHDWTFLIRMRVSCRFKRRLIVTK